MIIIASISFLWYNVTFCRQLNLKVNIHQASDVARRSSKVKIISAIIMI